MTATTTPTPEPTATTPPPSKEESKPAPEPTPPTPETPRPDPPAAPENLHKEARGWVNTTPGETTTSIRMPLAMTLGAQTVTLTATMETRAGAAGASPAHFAKFQIELLDPAGKVVKTAAFETADPTLPASLTLNLDGTTVTTTGEFVFVLKVENSVSDSASIGHAYAMIADVKY